MITLKSKRKCYMLVNKKTCKGIDDEDKVVVLISSVKGCHRRTPITVHLNYRLLSPC